MLFVYAARRVLRRASPLVIALTGLLFATHPIHTEAVSSIVGRAETLCAFFMLLSFLTYSGGFREHDSINYSLAKVVLSIVLAGCAVLCKEQGVTVIVVNAAYDFAVVSGLNVPRFLQLLIKGEVDGKKVDNDDATNQTLRDSPESNCTQSPSYAFETAPKVEPVIQQDDQATAMPAQQSDVASNDAPLPQPLSFELLQQLPSVPLFVRALLWRILVVAVGASVIVALRLSINFERAAIPSVQTNRLHHLVFTFNSVSSHISASNHIKAFFPRFLTKVLYNAYHAWLLIFPRHLNCDWSGGRCVRAPSSHCLSDVPITALILSSRSETRATWSAWLWWWVWPCWCTYRCSAGSWAHESRLR